VLARVHNLLEVRLLHKELHNYNDVLEQRVRERTADLQEGYLESIFTMTRAAEHKDEDTGAHVQRISYYSRELARMLGLDEEFIGKLFFASPMHDIGKIGISDHILLKPSGFTPDEWEVMKGHTTMGAKILGDSKSPYVANVMFEHKIFYENSIFLSVATQSTPYGVKGHYTETFAPSLRGFDIKMGYMEIVDIEEVLQSHGIAIGENVIFYGIEDIVTGNPLWKVFAFIKTNCPSFAQFYNFPTKKLLGVITSVKL
jgi:hypothetical protein